MKKVIISLLILCSLSIAAQVTPIHFSYFKMEKLSQGLYKASFTCDDLSDEDHFEIQVSKDGGSTFETVKTISKDDVKLGILFSTNVNIK